MSPGEGQRHRIDFALRLEGSLVVCLRVVGYFFVVVLAVVDAEEMPGQQTGPVPQEVRQRELFAVGEAIPERRASFAAVVICTQYASVVACIAVGFVKGSYQPY